MGTTPLRVGAVVVLMLVGGVVAAVTFQQILNPTRPAFAQDQFDCASFNSQAESQAELRRDSSDPRHIRVRQQGEHAQTVEVEPQEIYVDVDAEGHTLGVEFLSFGTFFRYIDEHGGLNLPERFAGPQSLVPA
jgi:hypothetical protein